METIRTFVAIKLDPEIRNNLGVLQSHLRHKEVRAKWVEPENIHLTMKFLGDTPIDKIDEIKAALSVAAAGFARFDISFKEIGIFPDERRPRVIWAGVEEGREQLVRIAAAVEEGLAGLGFQREERGFTAHVTLSRVRDARLPRQFFDSIQKLRDKEFGRMAVKKISLMKSTLTPKGPVYDTICDSELTLDNRQ